MSDAGRPARAAQLPTALELYTAEAMVLLRAAATMTVVSAVLSAGIVVALRLLSGLDEAGPGTVRAALWPLLPARHVGPAGDPVAHALPVASLVITLFVATSIARLAGASVAQEARNEVLHFITTAVAFCGAVLCWLGLFASGQLMAGVIAGFCAVVCAALAGLRPANLGLTLSHTEGTLEALGEHARELRADLPRPAAPRQGRWPFLTNPSLWTLAGPATLATGAFFAACTLAAVLLDGPREAVVPAVTAALGFGGLLVWNTAWLWWVVDRQSRSSFDRTEHLWTGPAYLPAALLPFLLLVLAVLDTTANGAAQAVLAAGALACAAAAPLGGRALARLPAVRWRVDALALGSVQAHLTRAERRRALLAGRLEAEQQALVPPPGTYTAGPGQVPQDML